jgi:hypothetical protein
MVMAVQTKAWEQVGEKFEVLGTHLRSHFDEVSAEATAERAAFEKSIRGLLASLEDGFGAAGKAVREPVLRQDVTDVAVSVREALLATFESAGEQVRERLTRPVRPTAKPVAAHKTTARKTTAGKAVAGKVAVRKAAPHKRASS